MLGCLNHMNIYLTSSYHELAGDGGLVGEGVDILSLPRVRLLLVENHQEVSDWLREVSSQGVKKFKNTQIQQLKVWGKFLVETFY